MQSECTLIGEAGNLIYDNAMLFDLVAGERPSLRAVRVKIRTVSSEKGIGKLGQKTALPLIENLLGWPESIQILPVTRPERCR